MDGRTPFVSGVHQAHWFLGLAQIYDGDTQRLSADGTPVTLLTMCPAIEAVIVDNWRTLGMRGTGSHDVVITDVFVPSSHTALLASYEKPGSAYAGPLYKFTIWTSISVLAAPALGIARAAIEDLLDLAARKTPAYLAMPLRDRPRFKRRSAKQKPRSAPAAHTSTKRYAKSGKRHLKAT